MLPPLASFGGEQWPPERKRRGCLLLQLLAASFASESDAVSFHIWRAPSPPCASAHTRTLRPPAQFSGRGRMSCVANTASRKRHRFFFIITIIPIFVSLSRFMFLVFSRFTMRTPETPRGEARCQLGARFASEAKINTRKAKQTIWTVCGARTRPRIFLSL